MEQHNRTHKLRVGHNVAVGNVEDGRCAAAKLSRHNLNDSDHQTLWRFVSNPHTRCHGRSKLRTTFSSSLNHDTNGPTNALTCPTPPIYIASDCGILCPARPGPGCQACGYRDSRAALSKSIVNNQKNDCDGPFGAIAAVRACARLLVAPRQFLSVVFAFRYCCALHANSGGWPLHTATCTRSLSNMHPAHTSGESCSSVCTANSAPSAFIIRWR